MSGTTPSLLRPPDGRHRCAAGTARGVRNGHYIAVTIRQGASAGPSSASVQRSVKVAALSFDPLTTAAVSRSST